MRAKPDPSHVCLAPGFALQPVDGLGVFFIGERRQWLSTSQVLLALSPLIDGRRGVDELIAAAAPRLSPPEVLFALNRLYEAGVIVSRPFPAPHHPPADRRSAIMRWAGGVAILSQDEPSGAAMAAALAQVGLESGLPGRKGRGDGAPRLLVVTDYLGPAAGEMIAEAESTGSTWMPVKLAGARSYFGPAFGPGLQTCWCCTRERLRAMRPVECWLEAAIGRPFGLAGTAAAPGAGGRALGVALAGHVAAAVADSGTPLTGLAAMTGDGILEWDAAECSLRRHRILRRTSCPHCGSEARAPRQLRFRDDIPLRRRAGGYRVIGARKTADRLDALVSDLTGPIASLERLETAEPRHVYAGAYLTVPRAARPAFDAFHGVCLGKGRDADQARASALCEAVERIAAGWRDSVPATVASLRDLGEAAIAPDRLWHFSAAQVAGRAAWNATTADPRRHVPEPLAPDQPIAWVRAWSLTVEDWRWLPRDHCFGNTPEPRHGRFNPNGHAAGGCVEEATLQAFLELVERDSVAIWWYNRLPRPGLDPATSDDVYLRGLAQGFAAQGWRCWLLDLTADLGIPCLAAVARAERDGRWCIGFGCHFETAVATERAMSELAQLFRADGRDGPPPWAPIADGDEAFLYPQGWHNIGQPPDAPTGGIATMAGLIGWCRDRVAARGMEMLVLDQTHPDIDLPVVKVTVPGLRHFWPRFGPGRLYDVPVAMGRRTEPLTEARLNPAHLFL